MTHWSTRLLARHLGIGDATVARAWRRYHVQPWRRETFKFSTDPALEARSAIVGLVPRPTRERHRPVHRREDPDPGARPDRAHPAPAPRTPERATHDYKRNGTTTLFAALEVATGRVTDRCFERHGMADFLPS